LIVVTLKCSSGPQRTGNLEHLLNCLGFMEFYFLSCFVAFRILYDQYFPLHFFDCADGDPTIPHATVHIIRSKKLISVGIYFCRDQLAFVEVVEKRAIDTRNAAIVVLMLLKYTTCTTHVSTRPNYCYRTNAANSALCDSTTHVSIRPNCEFAVIYSICFFLLFTTSGDK
jgi:hypothetical protein